MTDLESPHRIYLPEERIETNGVKKIIKRYREIPHDVYMSMLERRNWEKFGDDAGSTKELEPVSWDIKKPTLEKVTDRVESRGSVPLLSCKICKGAHFTHSCKEKVEGTRGADYYPSKNRTNIYAQKRSDAKYITIKVTNLSTEEDVTEIELFNFFSKFGKIKDNFKGMKILRMRTTRPDQKHYEQPMIGTVYVRYENDGDEHLIKQKMSSQGRHRHQIIDFEIVKNMD